MVDLPFQYFTSICIDKLKKLTVDIFLIKNVLKDRRPEKMKVFTHNLRNSQSSHEFLTSTNKISYITNLSYLTTRIQLQNYFESSANIVVKNELGMLSRDALAVCVWE